MIMENQSADMLSSIDLLIDNEVKQQFTEAAKWSKFISILVFVFAGIMLVVGIASSTFLLKALSKYNSSFFTIGTLGNGVIIAAVVVLVALFSFIYFFLYKFATKVKQAIATEDQNLMTEALGALKTFFIISTIFGGLSLLFSIVNLF
jgi:uncharacterized BrkB/YihY/UPF0761 family membrane protein